jgi:predicted anti-sigma-YlaC factor YlaD
MSTEANRRALLTRLLGPSEREVTCEACFELLDEYVDLELAGEDADRRVRGVREHLQGCPACREDHESLRDFVRLERPTPHLAADTRTTHDH